MKVEEIKKIACKSSAVSGYFQSLYQHSIQALESLSEDEVKELFESDYPNGQFYALWFNNYDNFTKISVDEMTGEDEVGLNGTVLVKSLFDYRGLTMILDIYPGADTVSFEAYYDEHEINENQEFYLCLTSKSYLHAVFGNYLLSSEGERSGKNSRVSFTVSNKFFEN